MNFLDVAWGGGRDALLLPQLPPPARWQLCSRSWCCAAIPVLVGPPGSRPDSANPHLQVHLHEQTQPCEDVGTFAPREMRDQPRQRLALLSCCKALPKNSSFPQKEHWDSGEGGDGGLENRSLHFEIKFGLETSSLILTKPSVSSISRRATRSRILEGRRGVGSAPSPWLW